MSSVYWPRPDRKRRSSLRFTLAPMPSKGVTTFIAMPPRHGICPAGAASPHGPGHSQSSCIRRPGRARRGLFGGGGQLRAAAVHHVLRRGDRLDDVVVARAAAEIALETLADLLLRQAGRVLLH